MMNSIPVLPAFEFALPWMAYLQTILWALCGGIGMGLGLIVALKTFTLLTKDVDEWALVKAGNVSMGIILGAVVLGTSFVIMMVAKP